MMMFQGGNKHTINFGPDELQDMFPPGRSVEQESCPEATTEIEEKVTRSIPLPAVLKSVPEVKYTGYKSFD